jgi:hypothetical protein
VTGVVPARFVLEAFSDGGLLLDLESGVLFTLNRTAVLVWQRALDGVEPAEIAIALAAMFDVSASVASADVDKALRPPRAHLFTNPSPSDFRYEASGDGYRFLSSGVPVLEVATSGRAVRKLPGFDPAEVGAYLRSIAPKLVALLGASVLHASAVARPQGGLVAFLGRSGAGKTTTARMFGRAGWSVVCEDKLVLRREAGGMAAVMDGESRLSAWIAQTRRHMVSATTDDWCDASALGEMTGGPSQPVVNVILVDDLRRRRTEIDLKVVTPVTAAGQIFQHGFYGSHAAKEWERQLRAAVTIARTARAFEATMPDSVQSLEEAARRYTEMTAS